MNLAGTATLTKNGKREIAASMFRKGCAFLGAYILLLRQDQSEPTEYVALHNLCQAVELILKSLLLFKDYDKFQPNLAKKNVFGHDLLKLVEAVTKAYSFHALSTKSSEELSELNKFYGSHRLRYGTGVDLFIAPHTIKRKRVVRLLARVIKISLLSK